MSMRRRLIAIFITALTLLAGGAVAYAVQVNLQSGKRVEHILLEEYANGGAAVGPGGVGMSVACPQGFYATGGGYEHNYTTQPNLGIRVWFNGPVAGWGGLGTGWSAAGETDTPGLFRVWVSCIRLTT